MDLFAFIVEKSNRQQIGKTHATGRGSMREISRLLGRGTTVSGETSTSFVPLSQDQKAGVVSFTDLRGTRKGG